MDEPEVLVVGAGPTGLAAACELARWGVRVQVVAASDGPFPGSRGKGLQPRTLEVLDGLGIAGRLISTGRFRMPTRHYAHDGSYRDLDLNPEAEPSPDSPYGRTLLLPQWRVEQTLRELLASHGVEVQWGRRVVGLDQDAGRVSVRFDNGGTASAGYLIGCDGGSSAVRQLLGVEFLGQTRENVHMLVGDVVPEGVDRDHWHIWSGEPWGVALCPLPATETFQFQAAMQGRDLEPSLEVFQDILDRVVGPGQVRLREATWMSRWRLNVRMVDRYRVGRAFLAGDAAHVHSPAGGQGMNTGIQDAVNLGWKLARVLAGAHPALLDSYQAERLPVAAGVLGLSNRLLTTPPGERESGRSEALQLDLSYRGGPLAPKAAPGPGPAAGDRAPDAPCRYPDATPVRLFDLQRGPHWTLLGFGLRPRLPGCPADIPVHPVGIELPGSTGAAGSPGSADEPAAAGAFDVVDADGHARAAYAAEPGDLVLIRPDGHIAHRARDPREIVDWLRLVS